MEEQNTSNISQLNTLSRRNFLFWRKITIAQHPMLWWKEKGLCFLPRGSWQKILQKKKDETTFQNHRVQNITNKIHHWSSWWKRTRGLEKKKLCFNFYMKENKKISPIKKISPPQATVSLILFFARERKFHLFKASTK